MEKKPGKPRLSAEQLSDVITAKELAAFLGVSIKMISNMVSRDEIKSFKFGSCRLFLKQDIFDMIGFCEQKEEELKDRADEVYNGMEEPKPQAEVKVIETPRTRTRGYESMFLGD